MSNPDLAYLIETVEEQAFMLRDLHRKLDVILDYISDDEDDEEDDE